MKRVEIGDVAPGGGNFTSIDGVLALADGALAFKGWVGSTIGLYLQLDGVTYEVASTARLLGGRKVSSFNFSHRGFDGRQLAFRATFADGNLGYGVFVATLDRTRNDGAPGSGGFVPRLALDGLPMPGETVTLTLAEGLGGAFTVVVFGDDFADLPMGRSGNRLHAAPLLPEALTLFLGGSGPGAGTFSLTEQIPPALTGVALVAQALLLDPAAPSGFTVSNGVRVLDYR